ncbi:MULTISPECIES: DNA polymerase Y family protein [Arthrobacter]|uniref:DNA polymerase Y family protein n=2 Tax=Arthrobacter TaxID=1663 RepID=A0ABU9KMI7_9MICC|nr:DNA polymerase Y family protein [Arthrobacter sp. YJM1]MDP5227962.1 DNA polymerase Y family protein [Arthrobacter sp. YJM1]
MNPETRAGIPRALVVWFPDWPIVAAQLAEEIPERVPSVLLEKGLVSVCSAEARAAGVVRRLRVREAQSRCPDLLVVHADPARDAREFEPVVVALEAALPGVQILRPGLCALRARGAARYYGSEENAVGAALEAAARLGLEARAGIADSVFAAEQAARWTTELRPLLIVPEGASARFLAELPVRTLGEPRLTSLLLRLGLSTLGSLAALPPSDVRARFGTEGLMAHARARGQDPRAVVPRVAPVPLDRTADFEPGLDRVDQIAFALRPTAEAFVEGLRVQGLACTSLRVHLLDDHGRRSERVWGHPHHFGTGDVVDRVRWQLQSEGSPAPSRRGTRPGAAASAGPSWRSTGETLGAPIVQVRLSPEAVDLLGRRGQTLFGGVEERLDHGLRRLQTMLGHGSVLLSVPGGGRLLTERSVLVPWGEDAPAGTAARADRPWPGTIPEPLPSTVFPEPLPVQLLDQEFRPLHVGTRGDLGAPPVWFVPGPKAARRTVRSWAGPWLLRQRWWDAEASQRAERFQILDGENEAWLLLGEGGRWWAEARYD